MGARFDPNGVPRPVQPLPPSPDPPYKTPVLVVRSDAGRAVLDLRELARRAGPDGAARVETAAGPVQVRAAEEPATALVEPGPGAPLPVAHASWFAWHAMYPDDPLVR